MENKTIAQEALEILEPIPAERWITDRYSNENVWSTMSEDEVKCCALGWVNKKTSGNAYFSRMEVPLREVTTKFLREVHNVKPLETFREPVYPDIANINNDPEYNGYIEDNSRDRVIHLLKDMVAAGY